MPSLDLPPKYQKELVKLIKEYMPDSNVWAYGSRITPSHHDTSDLDIVIQQKKHSIDKLVDLKDAIKNSNIPILVDVMDWDLIPESFKEEIQKKHISIYP
ncbi:MAG: nucleotidyltransferase domain-containing protein [Gammaproteobacteria bacterium]|nr:nucleotidyltransferase domain-containing protein [Gammaproteobacteria bacterium]